MTINDNFQKHASSLHSPASDAFSITPDDNIALPHITRAIYIGGPGTIHVVMQSDIEISFAGLPAGMVLPIRAKKIKATGTDATDLVGLV